jgi:hypothetical protein
MKDGWFASLHREFAILLSGGWPCPEQDILEVSSSRNFLTSALVQVCVYKQHHKAKAHRIERGH